MGCYSIDWACHFHYFYAIHSHAYLSLEFHRFSFTRLKGNNKNNNGEDKMKKELPIILKYKGWIIRKDVYGYILHHANDKKMRNTVIPLHCQARYSFCMKKYYSAK